MFLDLSRFWKLCYFSREARSFISLELSDHQSSLINLLFTHTNTITSRQRCWLFNYTQETALSFCCWAKHFSINSNFIFNNSKSWFLNAPFSLSRFLQEIREINLSAEKIAGLFFSLSVEHPIYGISSFSFPSFSDLQCAFTRKTKAL